MKEKLKAYSKKFKSGYLPGFPSNLSHKIEKAAKYKKIILAVYLLVAVFAFYHLLFARRIIPGVKIGSVSVGGLSFDQAIDKLEKREAGLQKDLNLKFADKIFLIKGEDIGLVYDWDAAVSRAFEVGRTGNLYIDNKDKIAGVVKQLYIAAFYDYENDMLSSKFTEIQGEINIEPIDADVEFLENELKVSDSQNGIKVDSKSLFKLVTSAFDKLDFSEKELPVEVVEPTIGVNDVYGLLSEVERIVFSDLVVKEADYKEEMIEKIVEVEPEEDGDESDKKDSGDDGNSEEDKNADEKDKETPKKETKVVTELVETGKKWQLTRDQMLDFLAFKRVEQEDGKSKVEAALDEIKFRAFVDELAFEVNILPRGKVTQESEGKVLSFELVNEGKELDADEFTERFKDAYFNMKSDVYLVMKKVSGPTDIEKYGIYALLGQGQSKFTGSAQARINNLTLAAERTSGVLVPPGKVYSMSEAVGDISTKTGYDTAWIIKGNKTVLGEGGGVCQTSTTLFRAVLNSGLPVVMRYPHAYRVYYYELDQPVGFDAAIYQPSVDFRFKNDTPNYVLVQSYADLKNSTLVFKLYGTPDGRDVEISEPIVTNRVPAPEPEYIDDPTLPKGEKKQIDFAASGADVSFTRVVNKGDEVLFEEKFTSKFKPWKAVYLVGTKED